MSISTLDKKRFENSVERLVVWADQHRYSGYDPGDGDLSWLRHLTFNNHFLKRLLTGVVLRSPFHIRPLIGIAPHTSTKGMGYFGWGYTKWYQLTGDEQYRRRADQCFRWLMENRAPRQAEFCWGNHFDFSTRAGTIPRHEPTIVWSSLIGLGFLESYEICGQPEYLEVAASVSRWIKTLPKHKTKQGVCLSYVPFMQSSIHNSNMLGAALLARVSQHTGDNDARNLAGEAMLYSCYRQNGDGSWFYGEAPKYRWIDCFHTGYNLDCLKRYMEATGDMRFEESMDRGFQYFKNAFIETDGRVKYYHKQLFPIDIQCVAQAIDTLACFGERHADATDLAANVARWAIDNMQGDDGHFYYRDLGWKKIETAMFHWGQGTMFKALAQLLVALKGKE